MRPSLTAAARHGRIILRVGAEEWLRQVSMAVEFPTDRAG
jgi:hypothetical protein